MNGYKKMRCTNKMTGEFIGYLGTTDNFVAIGPKLEDASDIKWEPHNNDEYLAKETTPQERYLVGALAIMPAGASGSVIVLRWFETTMERSRSRAKAAPNSSGQSDILASTT